MFRGPSSRNVALRLRDGKDSARAEQRFGADATFVRNVRELVNTLPNSGSQQHRLRHHDENWLISMWRWIVEHRKEGTDWHALRRVLAACVDEIDLRIEQEAIAGTITPEHVVDAAKVENLVSVQQDNAALEAAHLRTPGAYHNLAQKCLEEMGALRRTWYAARAMAHRLTQGTAR